MSRRGRPRRDTIALVARIKAVLDEEPNIPARAVTARVAARRQDVFRIVKVLRPPETGSQAVPQLRGGASGEQPGELEQLP